MTKPDKPVVIKDVARRAEVSVASVSRVLSGHPSVSDALRERVLTVVDELGYVPDRAARSLRTRRAGIVGLIVPDIENPFFTSIARAVEDVAQRHEMAVFLCNSDERAEKERFYLDLLQAERVAGIILVPTQDDPAAYAEVRRTTPLVAIDRTVAGLELDAVVFDNRGSAERLVARLIARGHRRVAALVADRRISTARERLAGYRRALERAGLPFDASLVLEGAPFAADGYRLTLDAFRDPEARPTALFASTKLMTLGAIRAVTELGLRVPEEVDVAALDSPGFLPINAPQLVVEQPTRAIGTRAMTRLLERLEHPGSPPERIVLRSRMGVPDALAAEGTLG